mmetsp:Transcript_62579/g.159110  ORF Transcript_62579/g.159110 Transcript_62579/m.159110 type:complete len:251 (-) Transcript_62579:581-1333(-)
MSTEGSDQNLRFFICFNLPPFVKKSREYFPDVAQSFGGWSPISSAMSARWSSSRFQESPVRGSKRKSPVISSKNIHAALQLSAVSSHFAPMITSGERYCRVWMSSVTCLWDLQPLPKSANFAKTCSNRKVSNRSRCRTGGTGVPQACAAALSGSSSSSPASAAAAAAAGASSFLSAAAPVPSSCAFAFFFFSFIFARFFWLLVKPSKLARVSVYALCARQASLTSSPKSCLWTRTFSNLTSVWMTPLEWM